eukprot:4955317-Amphidinium_carterae.1
MDECDGMSGGDKGGMQALINMVKVRARKKLNHHPSSQLHQKLGQNSPCSCQRNDLGREPTAIFTHSNVWQVGVFNVKVPVFARTFVLLVPSLSSSLLLGVRCST